MRSIVKVFGRSPFIPLQLHMEKVAECVERIPEIIETYRKGDIAAVESLTDKMSKLEHEADNIKNDIRNSLPRGLFMPVQRTNLLNILRVQDSIANRAENICVLLTFKQANVYEGFNEAFDAFTAKSLETFNITKNIINELDELLETGFGGVEARSVEELVEKVALREHETDVLQHDLVRSLLAHEDLISYGDFFLWTRIIQQIAGIADRSESLAMSVRMTLESG